MKISFDSWREWEEVRNAAHDGVLYWLKVKQMVEGKINMNVNKEVTQYSMDEVYERILSHARVLDMIEKQPHPHWEGDEMIEEKYDSAMIMKCKRIAARVEIPF